jgi:hypothetical protein
MPKDIFPKQFFCGFCNSCEQVADFTGFKNSVGSEIFCGGLIKKPRKPKDGHEKMNRIRFCTVESGEESSESVYTLNVTEMEAAELIRILSCCLGESLARLQPIIKEKAEST